VIGNNVTSVGTDVTAGKSDEKLKELARQVLGYFEDAVANAEAGLAGGSHGPSPGTLASPFNSQL